uniref:hypothetical protein n=1 Tax=Paenibacillus sp. 203 TaxID=3096765 RepID=UPI003009177C
SEGAAGSPPFYGESFPAMETFKYEALASKTTHSLLSFESSNSHIKIPKYTCIQVLRNLI